MNKMNKHNEQLQALVENLEHQKFQDVQHIEKQSNPEQINSNKQGEEKKEFVNLPPISSDANSPTIQSLKKPEETQIIENILSEGLSSLYLGLNHKQQTEFKVRGEETAIKISQILQKGKIKFRNILDMVKKWLKLIPGVNSFYLEQESKIKTIKIIKYNQNKK